MFAHNVALERTRLVLAAPAALLELPLEVVLLVALSAHTINILTARRTDFALRAHPVLSPTPHNPDVFSVPLDITLRTTPARSAQEAPHRLLAPRQSRAALAALRPRFPTLVLLDCAKHALLVRSLTRLKTTALPVPPEPTPTQLLASCAPAGSRRQPRQHPAQVVPLEHIPTPPRRVCAPAALLARCPTVLSLGASRVQQVLINLDLSALFVMPGRHLRLVLLLVPLADRLSIRTRPPAESARLARLGRLSTRVVLDARPALLELSNQEVIALLAQTEQALLLAPPRARPALPVSFPLRRLETCVLGVLLAP